MRSPSSSADRLPEIPDGDVIRELTAVKGVGERTARLLPIFTLNRPDVLPTGDLGVRDAAMRAYGLERPPRPRSSPGLAEPGTRTAPAPACTCGAASTTSPPDPGYPHAP